MSETDKRIALNKRIEELWMKYPPYSRDVCRIEIKIKRHFHYEPFPGFIGPEGRRFIFLEWIWMLIFNLNSYIFNRAVCRTLWRWVQK